MEERTIIIGGGVVGLSIALQLSEKHIGGEIYLVGKYRIPHDHQQSVANSGVNHAGIYYSRSSQPLMAELSVRGNFLLHRFCLDYGVRYSDGGKIIVGMGEQDRPYLEEVIRTATENNVEDVCWIGTKEIKEKEPNAHGEFGLWVPSSGVIDPMHYVTLLRELVRSKGVEIVENSEVVEITPKESSVEVSLRSQRTNTEFTRVINAAGLYADQIWYNLHPDWDNENPDLPLHITPHRGESAIFYFREGTDLTIQRNIYPTPYGYDPLTGKIQKIPFDDYRRRLEEGTLRKFVGVHLTPVMDLDGRISGASIGPLKSIPDDGNKDDFCGVHPVKDFKDAVREIFPSIDSANVQLYHAGNMAVLPRNRDWFIQHDPIHQRIIHLIGISSPGLTASLAIGEYVSNVISQL